MGATFDEREELFTLMENRHSPKRLPRPIVMMGQLSAPL